ncbi:MAG: GNAT family N-acetyltransferase [Bacteroidetes bacterium]|nr:GNAT family N-acetyltransferase [Bacteroidota bacterium]
MSITIKEVSNKKEMNAFLDLPYRLYKGNPYFVPPLRFDEAHTLDKKKNPAFEHCDAKFWIALKDGRVVGRIAGIINNNYISKWKNKYARFGWIDFEEDEAIAKALLNTAEDWAKQNGMTAIQGPLGFTDLDHEGLLVDGFDQVATLATLYTHPYYKTFIENNGYTKDADWVEYNIKMPKTLPENLTKIASIVERRYGLQVVKAKKPKDILPYAKDVFNLINDAYSDLFGVTELTEKQIEYYTKAYFGFMKVDFVSLIVDKNNQLVAFGITMPSLSEALQKSGGSLFPFGFIHILKAMSKPKKADFLMIAIKKDLQGKGINAVLMREIGNAYIKRGIESIETNHELELNTKVQTIWKDFDHVQHKRRRCYIKHLS